MSPYDILAAWITAVIVILTAFAALLLSGRIHRPHWPHRHPHTAPQHKARRGIYGDKRRGVRP